MENEINKCNEKWWYSAFLMACELGLTRLVEKFVEQGARPDHVFEGGTPLQLSFRVGQEDVFAILISRVENAVKDETLRELIQYITTSIEGTEGTEDNVTLKMIKLALQNGADVHSKNRDGKTIIELAVEKSDEEVVPQNGTKAANATGNGYGSLGVESLDAILLEGDAQLWKPINEFHTG
eukprot:Nk52_evm62s208 gene=Nk52_evmTU62s208